MAVGPRWARWWKRHSLYTLHCCPAYTYATAACRLPRKTLQRGRLPWRESAALRLHYYLHASAGGELRLALPATYSPLCRLPPTAPLLHAPAALPSAHLDTRTALLVLGSKHADAFSLRTHRCGILCRCYRTRGRRKTSRLHLALPTYARLFLGDAARTGGRLLHHGWYGTNRIWAPGGALSPAPMSVRRALTRLHARCLSCAFPRRSRAPRTRPLRR